MYGDGDSVVVSNRPKSLAENHDVARCAEEDCGDDPDNCGKYPLSELGGHGAIKSFFVQSRANVRRESRPVRVLVIGVALAAGAIWCVSSLGTSFWLSGSFLPLLTIIPLAAGVTLGGIAWQSTTAVLIALGMIALPAYTSVRLPRSGEADTRLVAQILDENAGRSTLVFGSPSDAYSIARAYERYGSGSISLQETRNPASTFWSLYENDRCTTIDSWPVGGDIDLRLCLGWEEGSAE